MQIPVIKENFQLLFFYSGKAMKETFAKNETSSRILSVKKKKRVMPPIPISEMNEILFRNYASYHSVVKIFI